MPAHPCSLRHYSPQASCGVSPDAHQWGNGQSVVWIPMYCNEGIKEDLRDPLDEGSIQHLSVGVAVWLYAFVRTHEAIRQGEQILLYVNFYE